MRPGRAERQGRRYGAGLLALAASAAACGMTPAGARGAGPEVTNLRVGFTNNASGNLFKIGTWTPVWVQVKGGTERFSGVVEVEVPDDDGTPTLFRQVLDVAAGGDQTVVTYARPGSRDPGFTLRLYDEKGRRVGPVVDGSQLAQLNPVQADETLLVTLGKAQGVEQIPSLPGFTQERNNSGTGPSVAVARVESSARTMPGRWYGYDSAEAVVVDTNDKDVMEALTVRGQGLVDWVARGGHLVVAVGGNWQSVRDSVLGPILPAVPAGQERVASLDALESYASATKQIAPPGSGGAQVAKLEQVEERNGRVLLAAGAVPLVVRGPYGFGRVTLLTFDVDQKPFADWADRALFWVKATDLKRGSASGTGAETIRAGGGQRLYQSGVSDLATQLRTSLEQFPGVKLIPFGWVAFFIFLYILLIGPGDYLFLKKVVKRMELTWVTFPLIVLSVSLLAYAAAYFVKGKELRVNKVDVVDVDVASGVSRGTSFVNLFSPQNRDYGVGFEPVPLDKPADPVARGGAVRPPAGTEVLTSWLGVPEPGFGGMGGTNRIGFTGGGYASEPVGGSERLEGVRIPIWSTKLLTGRWFGPAGAPAVESDVTPAGTDRLAGTVTNRLDVPLNDAVLAYGKNVYELKTIAPGATVRVELAADRQLRGFLKDRTRDDLPNAAAPASKLNRADLALALMFHDGGTSSVSTEASLASNPLHYLDLTGQLALDRPMLVARLERPAARLVLENAPANPRVEQTTMLRVILPLAKP